jgi:hypothetical protein
MLPIITLNVTISPRATRFCLLLMKEAAAPCKAENAAVDYCGSTTETPHNQNDSVSRESTKALRRAYFSA